MSNQLSNEKILTSLLFVAIALILVSLGYNYHFIKKIETLENDLDLYGNALSTLTYTVERWSNVTWNQAKLSWDESSDFIFFIMSKESGETLCFVGGFDGQWTYFDRVVLYKDFSFHDFSRILEEQGIGSFSID